MEVVDEWDGAPRLTALMIEGSRQIGETCSTTEYGDRVTVTTS